MSGLASVVLAVWAVFFPPADIYASRTLLWIATVACILIASYRIWAKERDASLAKRAELEGLIHELTRHRLIPIVKENKCQVSLWRYWKQEADKKRLYMEVTLTMCFENTDTDRRVVKAVNVSLIEMLTSGAKEETPLESLSFLSTRTSAEGKIELPTGKSFEIEPRSYNPDVEYCFAQKFLLPERFENKLAARHFLRADVLATNQVPYRFDIFVKWNNEPGQYSDILEIRASQT